LSVPDESYSRNVLCALNLISTFLLQIPMQSVPITTKVVRFIHARGDVYSIQHYVIGNDIRQVDFFWYYGL